MYDLTQ
ncbi:Protein of unknown function [Bacillus mycoides]|nr:Protein of unknown function [Bacillus mycoides]